MQQKGLHIYALKMVVLIYIVDKVHTQYLEFHNLQNLNDVR